MSEVQLATALEKQIWTNDYFREYVRMSTIAPYMGKAASSIIVAKYEPQEEGGKTINIPLITRIRSKGVGGSTVLDGNEVDIGNYNCGVSVDWIRNGVRVPKSTSYKTEIDLLGAAKPLLKEWAGETLRDDCIYAFMEMVTTGDTTVPYAEIVEDTTNGGFKVTSGYTPGSSWDRYEGVTWTSASEANKDAWLTANSDRVLFGSARSNAVSNDHSAALALVDTTNDRMSSSVGSLGKRMAKAANPHIRPYKLEDGREFFVCFTGPRSFRDLKADSVMTQANREARERSVANNPIFQDGDLIYDGVIYKEFPEIPHIVGVGASSCDIEPNFLCGQQAAAIAWGQEPTPRTDYQKDYGFRPGVATEELRKVKKMAFNGKQHGMVTIYTAAAADA